MKTSTAYAGANGTLTLPLGWRGAWLTPVVTGGPFAKFPASPERDQFGVCLRAEIEDPDNCRIYLPIRDFSVPTDDGETTMALLGTVAALVNGRDVYVGCMGGWGRTGLFLALLAKSAGQSDPVGYVREHYTPHAVETAEQVAFVRDFDTSAVTKFLYREAWRSRLTRLWSR